MSNVSVENKVLFDTFVERAKNQLEQLEDKPEETAEATVSALIHFAAGNKISAEASLEVELPQLTDESIEKFKSLFKERVSGKPLGHITGRQRFMGIEMIADKDALIPRKETELLGQLGIEAIEEAFKENSNPLVIDVCTGSGNLACAYAKNFNDINVYAADLSEEAIELAKKNADFIGVSDNTEFRSGDLLEPFNSDEFLGKVDVLTCNPPYISSKKLEEMPGEIISHEPKMAFNGGSFGINILGKLSKEAKRYLKTGGYFCMEIGLGQGPGMIKMFERTGSFKLVKTLSDKNDNIRAISFKKVDA